MIPDSPRSLKLRLNNMVSLSNGLFCLLVLIVMTFFISCNSNTNQSDKSKDKDFDYANMSKEELLQLESKGDCHASLQLGRNTWKEHKYDEAVKYFQNASKSQDPEIKKIALYNLGASQTQKNESAVIQWISESADMGYAPAQGVYAANLIKNGNLKKGYEYAQKSIKQNDAMGYYALALYYSILTSDNLLLADDELPRDNDMVQNDRGLLSNLHKSAELGFATSFYALINLLGNNNASKQEIISVINQYKDKYPQLSHDLLEITEGNNSCKATERWTEGWLLLDDIIR